MSASIKVSLLGQNAIIREGLRRILLHSGVEVSQSVDSIARLHAEVDSDDLLIIVDGQVAPANIKTLHQRFPGTKLVVLGEAFDFHVIAEAFRAGAHGYIIKEICCESLIASLKLAATGEKIMPSSLADALHLFDDDHERERDRHFLDNAHLSAREGEILSFLIMGCPNKVISRRLAISEATVKVHVKAILRKLRVQNRTQAAIRGVNGGLDSHIANSFADTALLVHESPPRPLRSRLA
jgi:two-component system, NarL family, nitrate/nitrite response regulator NarL